MCVAARVDHPVGVQDEEPHMGIVDRRLGASLPGLACLGVAAVGSDELDLGQVTKHRCIQMAELAADHEVEQLLGFDFGMLGHGGLFGDGKGYAPSGIGAVRRTING